MRLEKKLLKNTHELEGLRNLSPEEITPTKRNRYYALIKENKHLQERYYKAHRDYWKPIALTAVLMALTGCSSLRLSPDEETRSVEEWRRHADQYMRFNHSRPFLDNYLEGRR